MLRALVLATLLTGSAYADTAWAPPTQDAVQKWQAEYGRLLTELDRTEIALDKAIKHIQALQAATNCS